jgi:hypothetical protein
MIGQEILNLMFGNPLAGAMPSPTLIRTRGRLSKPRRSRSRQFLQAPSITHRNLGRRDGRLSRSRSLIALTTFIRLGPPQGRQRPGACRERGA